MALLPNGNRDDAAQACMAAHIAMMSKEKQREPVCKKLKNDDGQGGKGSRQQNWTRSCILALIELVKKNFHRFQDKLTKTNTIWNQIAAELKEKDENMTAEIASKKWANLKYKYKKFVDNVTQTGSAAQKKPEFYEEIDEILRGSHALRPRNVVQCGLNPVQENEGVEEPSISNERTKEIKSIPQDVQPSGSGRSSRSDVLSPLIPDSLIPEETDTPIGRKEKRIRPLSRTESIEMSIKDLVNILKINQEQEKTKIKMLGEELKSKSSFRELVLSGFKHEELCTERYKKLEDKIDKLSGKLDKIIEVISGKEQTSNN